MIGHHMLHPSSTKVSFCFLEWGGEKGALPESRQAFKVVAAQTSGLVNLVSSRQTGFFKCEHPFIDKTDDHNWACSIKRTAFWPEFKTVT